MKILIADDDPQILKALRIILTAHGYDVVVAQDGRAALDAAAHDRPDLVVLDLGMPRLDGIQVIQAVRGWTNVPILVVSGRSDIAGKVDALDAGANDYVVKPFATEELLARIRALTRQTIDSDDNPEITFGDVTVDLTAHQIERAGHEIRLTPTEWAILETLIRNPRRLITQRAMLTQVWGADHHHEPGNLRVHLASLRKKVETDPSRPAHLITEAGIGYRFAP